MHFVKSNVSLLSLRDDEFNLSDKQAVFPTMCKCTVDPLNQKSE